MRWSHTLARTRRRRSFSPLITEAGPQTPNGFTNGPGRALDRQPAPAASAATDALAAIERLGIPVLRTWRRGAIRVRWCDDGIVARAFRDESQEEPADPHWVNGQSDRGPAQHSQGTPPRAWSRSPALRFLTGLAGFAMGAFACLVLAVVEIGAWALVLPARSVANRRDSATGAPNGQPEPVSVVIQATDGAHLAARWFPAPGLA